MSISDPAMMGAIPFPLPPAPEGVTGPVLAWSEPVPLPCPAPPYNERHPIFCEYPYPVPVLAPAAAEPRTWQAVHLENEWLRLLIIPEADGYLYLAIDGTTGSNLLPLPEQLRIRPCAFTIEEHGDGARTVWCTRPDEKTRVRVSHGFTLYPGRAYLELKVRLFNQSVFPEPFETPRLLAGGGDSLVHLADERLEQGKLFPFETKSWSEFVYALPLSSYDQATVDAAKQLRISGRRAELSLCVTSSFPGARLVMEWHGLAIGTTNFDLKPGEAFRYEVELPAALGPDEVVIRLTTSRGRELLRSSRTVAAQPEQPPALDTAPRKVTSTGELHRLGDQHPDPSESERYWREALRRDTGDERANAALGLLEMRRGELEDAETHLRRAMRGHGEGEYLLGACLRYLGRSDEAKACFEMAARSFPWRSAALYALAELELAGQIWEQAPKHLYAALRLNADNNLLRNLAAVVFRRFGRSAQADGLLTESLALDAMDPWAQHLAGKLVSGDNQVRIDVALHCMRAGLFAESVEVLTGADIFADDGSVPLVHYLLAFADQSEGESRQADSAPVACSRPYRLEEFLILQSAVLANPSSSQAFYLLGNWLQGHGRPEQAAECWTIANQLRPDWAPVLRNLGRFSEAFAVDPTDAQLLHECKQDAVSAEDRLRLLESHPDLVAQREDLTRELAGLYSLVNQPERSIGLLREISGSNEQLAGVELKLGRRLLDGGEPASALGKLQEALALDGAKPEIYFWMGECYSALKNIDAAAAAWHKAVAKAGELSDQTYFQALSWARLGDSREARTLLRQLWFHGRRVAREKGADRKVEGLYLQSQARVGMGQWKLARKTLDQLLTLDPNQEKALDLIRELPT